nr:hypothetical protein [Neobacillus sp. Marseille-Q6967]
MKQTLSMLFSVMLLVGCSANPTPENDKTTTSGDTTKTENTVIGSNNDTKQEEKQEQDLFEQYQPNPQVTDDRSLQQVGQTVTDGKGEATLRAIKNVNKTYKAGPIELKVKEIKLIHLRPDYGMIDYFHVLTHDEEFDFVKVFVEIKNTSQEKVNFAPIALVETNTGETFDWEQDIYLEELNGEIEPNSTKFGNLGFIVNASDSHLHKDEQSNGDGNEKEQTKNIKWIEITTSDVFDKEKKKINDSQKIKIEFNL